MKKIKDNRYFHSYYKYFRPALPRIIPLILLIMVGVVSGNINPFIYGRIIDFISSGNMDTLVIYIFAYFAIYLFAMALSMVERWMGQMVSYAVSSEVRKELFAKIVRMRLKSLDKYDVGELISRLDSDAGTIVDFCINVATSIILIVFKLIVSLYFVFTISAGLSFVSVFFIPASAIVTIVFRKKFRKLETKQKKYADKYMSFVNETFSNIRGIRSFSLENNSDSRFISFISERLKLLKDSVRLGNTVAILNNLISTSFGLVIIYLSAKYIQQGALTIGSMVAFNTYVNKLFDAVSRVLSMNTSMQGVVVAMDRVSGMISEPDETLLYKGTVDTGEINMSTLSVDGLMFRYREKYVIESLNIACGNPGLYAVVGRNGCGKSTLAKLIMGFYDCEEGSIRFGDHTKEEIGLSALRQHITYVQKEPFIVNDSITNNIRMVAPCVSEEAIIEMSKRVGFHEFVVTLDEKYDTILGAGGVFLSSGQKQKLSLVRALLCDTQLVILDEVTSDLDGVAEKEVISCIRELSKYRIVLFVSHKITSIIDSDRIYLIDGGKLMDSGAHADLLERSKLYRELFWLEKDNRAE